MDHEYQYSAKSRPRMTQYSEQEEYLDDDENNADDDDDDNGDDCDIVTIEEVPVEMLLDDNGDFTPVKCEEVEKRKKKKKLPEVTPTQNVDGPAHYLVPLEGSNGRYMTVVLNPSSMTLSPASVIGTKSTSTLSSVTSAIPSTLTVMTSREPPWEEFVWDHEATMMLFDEYTQVIPFLGTRKIRSLKALYTEIARRMQTRGQNVTVNQVENKYKVLVRSYRNHVANYKRTGFRKRPAPYEKQVIRMLELQRNVTNQTFDDPDYEQPEYTTDLNDTTAVSNSTATRISNPASSPTPSISTARFLPCASTSLKRKYTPRAVKTEPISTPPPTNVPNGKVTGEKAATLTSLRDELAKQNTQLQVDHEERSCFHSNLLQIYSKWTDVQEEANKIRVVANGQREARNNLLEEQVTLLKDVAKKFGRN